MIKMYYRGVHCALITFDLTNRESFESVDKWFQDGREKQVAPSKGFSAGLIYFVVGNKSDLKRQITTLEAETMVKEYKE